MTPLAAAAAVVALAAIPSVAAADRPKAGPPPVDVTARGEIIAAALVSSAAGRTDRRFVLDTAELGFTADVDYLATGELVLEAVRRTDAGADGSIGVRVKRATVGAHRSIGDARVDAAFGVIGDPWLAALGDFPLRTLGFTTAEEQGLVASSDLGAAARVAYRQRAALQVALTSGEGAHRDERNQGKDVSVVATVRAPDTSLGTFDAHAYGRHGSIGPDSVRNHRAGAAVAWHHPRRFAAGADVVWAWGVAERGDVTAWTVDVWADLPVRRGLGVALRWDLVDVAGPADPPDRWRATGGPWIEWAGAVRVTAALQLERAGAGAPLAGVPTATDATRVLILAQGSFATRPR